jgi:hypothetical protein
MTYAILTPAYGRDYANKQVAIGDLRKGWDFISQTGAYAGKPVNLIQLMDAGITEVKIRYNGLRKVAVVKLGEL